MPAWATVSITLGASAIAVAGTIAATLFQLRHARRERAAQDQAARRARAAEVLGRVRTLIADLEPTRLGFNVNEGTPAELQAIRERWALLRDQVSVFAAGDEDAAVTDAAAKLEVAVSNTLNRVAWHVHDLLAGGAHAGDMYEQALNEHTRAVARVRIVLDLVRGRDVSELEEEILRLDDRQMPP